jgi:hypothetical protein
MSLTVPAGLLERASHGEVAGAEFLECVRTSLPYAWDVVTGLVGELAAGDGEFADNWVPPPDEEARGQLLRMMASDAMRAAIERATACDWRSRTATARPSSGRRRPTPWRRSPHPGLSSSTRVPSGSTASDPGASAR